MKAVSKEQFLSSAPAYRSAPTSTLLNQPLDQRSLLPHITVIRPIEGIEPCLRECLESTFRQTYPSSRLTICFCISSPRQAGLSLLKELVAEFPDFDTRIYVESEDQHLQQDGEGSGRGASNMGPNPKIRNMSKAYRETTGEVIWIIDCNVWVGRGVAGRMIDALYGFDDGQGGKKKNKFVHLLPLAVEINPDMRFAQKKAKAADMTAGSGAENAARMSFGKLIRVMKERFRFLRSQLMQQAGGKLEEIFMSSSHAKFYTAINTVLVAPCIVGKSTMFRRAHLDALTSLKSKTLPSDESRPVGIDYFSHNICEDHLIGDLLWKNKVPEEQVAEPGVKWGKHALVYGDVAIRPTADMSIADYIGRRVRWLRVRKFTVTVATLVEPATESFVCSLLGACGFTNFMDLPGFLFFGASWNRTWSAFVGFWLVSQIYWATLDWTLYLMLRSGASIEIDKHTPSFLIGKFSDRHDGHNGPDDDGIDDGDGDKMLKYPSNCSPQRESVQVHKVDQPDDLPEASDHDNSEESNSPNSGKKSKRRNRRRRRRQQRIFSEWLLAWLGREILAFPIWFYAVFCGSSVTWHGKKYRVRRDNRVQELKMEKRGHDGIVGRGRGGFGRGCERKKTE